MSYRPRWDSGDWLAICDSCGRKYKASSLRLRWDGLMVCQQDFEMRQPQDFVHGVADQIAPPWTRPETSDQFATYCTFNGTSCYADWAVADCAIADFISPFFDATIDPIDCDNLTISSDTDVLGWETLWVCTDLIVDAGLTLDGTIGIYNG